MQPRKAHGTDFARVRNWALNGWSQYYRQSLVFSSQPLPLITALFAKKCKNYAGKVVVSNPVLFGSVYQVAVKVPQVYSIIFIFTIHNILKDIYFLLIIHTLLFAATC